MKKVKNKAVNVRKQLKVKLENTATRYKNTKGLANIPKNKKKGRLCTNTRNDV